MSQSRIRVAIIGGGLAGVTLANALIKVPHLDLDLYESAPEFSERGAAVTLGPYAQTALQQIFPSVKETLKRAGGVPKPHSRSVLGSGPDAGTVLFDVASPGDAAFVLHRASLLRELLAPLPKKILHANHQLTDIRAQDDGLDIVFQDGTVKQFDAVIGADGIFSKVRKYVVGDDAEYEASPGGFWDCRLLVPHEKACSVVGDEYFELDREYGWIGNNCFIMHDVLENRTMVQFVLSAIDKEVRSDRERPLTRELLADTLKDWPDKPIAQAVIELLSEAKDLKAYSEWEHKSTPAYAKGHVCVVGDAAHAATPWQGAGAGLAIEDAAVLGHLLAQVKGRDELDACFSAFDAVRRPRGQRVVDSSRGTGQILCGRDPDIGLDGDKLKKGLPGRWAFIWGLDLAAHQQDALEAMQAILSK
ncbi:salicylate hydroxylase [Xylariomycetidae sp. FL2044]|nr:salicylate hydroxylase [Xylariomycetidae sp. FL2044]